MGDIADIAGLLFVKGNIFDDGAFEADLGDGSAVLDDSKGERPTEEVV